jgi:hypothetical protein
MNDPKIEELRLLHKDLAAYLKQQHEAVSNCLLTVAALRKTVETRTDLHEAYKAKIRELSEDETFRASLSSSNTLENLLQRLEDW